MAESELAVLSTQCLDRRISDKTDLVAEVAAWQKRRNTLHAKADWFPRSLQRGGGFAGRRRRSSS